MKTVQDKESGSSFVEIPYPSCLSDDSKLTFEIKGLNHERSYEDRDVFLNIKGDDGNINITTWIRGESAIDLGLKLIEHGKFALESNMINHQLIHKVREFKKYLEEDRVEEVEFKLIDSSPVNYGDGFKKFKITPYWIEGKQPEYADDFSFEHIIYWSPFEDKYADQLDYYTHGCSYSFIGYDRELEVKRFDEQCRLMAND